MSDVRNVLVPEGLEGERVDAAVAATAPLDVPGDELHGGSPFPVLVSGCRRE